MISSAVLQYGTFGNDGVFGVLGLSAHGPHLVVQLLQAAHSSAQSPGRPDMNEVMKKEEDRTAFSPMSCLAEASRM